MQQCPLEEQDQMALAELLDWIGVKWIHVANETKAKPQYMAKRKRLGVKPGFPDVAIFDPPPNYKNAVGAMIELKRKTGGKVSPEQTIWLECLRERGWQTAICCGFDDAKRQLKVWGYL